MGMLIKDYMSEGNIKLSEDRITELLFRVWGRDKSLTQEHTMNFKNKEYNNKTIQGKTTINLTGNYTKKFSNQYQGVLNKKIILNEELVA